MSGQWDESPYGGDGQWRDDTTDGAVRTTAAGAGVPAPRTGGRAEARRAAQGRGGRGGSGGGRAAGGGRGRKPQRNKKKYIAWTAAGAMVLIVAAGGALYLKINGNIKTFDSDAISADRPPETQADANGNKPVNVLLIGSDSRSGNNSDLGGGDEGGARSDTTILLHVYADHKHAVGISIPRDALVTVPSCKLPNGKWTKELTNQMFNSAFSVGNSEEGNPACTQNTVEKLTGIRVDHTIEVNFEGFAAMTAAVNGVDVCLPNAIYENDLNEKLPKKGAEVFKKGPQTVQGKQALDYVRLRHGIGDGSDVGRMKRQQAFMGSLISKVKKQGLSPTTLLPLADAATKSMTVDPELSTADKLLSFALSMKNIDMHDLKFITTPWAFSTAHEGRIDLVHPAVDNLWATLKADRTIDGQDATGQQPDAAAAPAAPATTAAPAPAAPAPAADTDGTGIKVAVYNGTTAAGMAGKASETLKGAKFTVTKVATASSTNHTSTVVEYGPGMKAKADKVAALFPGATTVTTSAPGISLVLGKDYAAANATTVTPGSAATPTEPPPLPTSVTAEARSADDDICANTTYGAGG
ncbi:LCP family protein [Streptomyces sp. CB03911]|uniref:LCP family protein n=1 Tax=Streptomycetaceae TaxID=2062 RepID=UPI0009A11FAA|nr:LCP family protein [Streptomyces sp. CB03911]